MIRSLSDRGSVHLIDDRFDRPEVRRLLPGWWAVETGAAGGGASAAPARRHAPAGPVT